MRSANYVSVLVASAEARGAGNEVGAVPAIVEELPVLSVAGFEADSGGAL
jgi:hypothetical protein